MTAVDVERFEGTCEGCGIGMSREVPTLARGAMADRWRHAPFWCDQCLAVEEMTREARAAKKAFDERVERSGLPLSRRRRLTSLVHEQSVIDMCRAWVRGELPGLLLTGPVGTGKTTVAGAAMFELLESRPALWAPLGTFFARLSLPFAEPGRAWATSVVDGDIALALDDLDKARNTEFGREQVFTAIDHRIELGLPLIITANMGLDEIEQRFGPAVVSRLAGYCAVAVVDGPDRRLAVQHG